MGSWISYLFSNLITAYAVRGGVVLHKFFAFISCASLFFLYCLFSLAPSLIAYADGTDYFDIIFGGRISYGEFSTPDSAPPSDYSYSLIFAAPNGGGYAICSDSPTLIANTGRSSDYWWCDFSKPDGTHWNLYSWSGSSPTVYSTSSGARSLKVYNSNHSYKIISNTFNIVAPDDSTIRPPDRTDKFTLSVDVNSDKSLSARVTSNFSATNYNCDFFVCPLHTLSDDTINLVVGDLWSTIERASSLSPDDDEYSVLLGILRDKYPLTYKALEHYRDGDGELQTLFYEYSVSKNVSIPSGIADGLSSMSTLVTDYNTIYRNSYDGYRGFGGGYLRPSASCSFSLSALWKNTISLPNYSDESILYAVVYSDSGAPISILSCGFSISDWFPSVTLPEFSVTPEPSIIDGIPSVPSSGSDWTIYQHAMYMRALFDRLSTHLSISVEPPDLSATYDYDVADLSIFDMSVPDTDFSYPDGVPEDFTKPVQLFGFVVPYVFNAFSFTHIITFFVGFGVVLWLIWGRK